MYDVERQQLIAKVQEVEAFLDEKDKQIKKLQMDLVKKCLVAEKKNFARTKSQDDLVSNDARSTVQQKQSHTS